MALSALALAAALTLVGPGASQQANITKGTEHCFRPSCENAWTHKLEAEIGSEQGDRMTYCTMLPPDEQDQETIKQNLMAAAGMAQDALALQGKIMTGEGHRTLWNNVMESYCAHNACQAAGNCKGSNPVTFDHRNAFYTQQDPRHQKGSKSPRNQHQSQGRGNQRRPGGR